MSLTNEKPNSNAVNSKTYWDDRFAVDWEISQGREQSRFFSRLAIQHFPDWLVQSVKTDSLTLCDWGCAQGDGTDLLAEFFDTAQVTGVDFSPEAIEKALKRYPKCKFICEDFISSQEGEQFDVLFSSNTLEHFANPWHVLEQVSRRGRKFLVLLLPFREYERIKEHFATFDFNNVPVFLQDWVVMHSAVIDAAAVQPNYWDGEQVLLVYGRAAQAEKLKLSLSDIAIDTPAALLKRNAALADKAAALAERDAIKSLLQTAYAERDAAQNLLETLRRTRSWRITSPVRFAARTFRYGFIPEDRRRLVQALRGIYRRLPLPLVVRKALRSSCTHFFFNPYRAVRRLMLARTRFTPPAVKPVAQEPNKPDYIVWGVIDWHFRHQRPQQLAQALSASGRRVFYVSVNLKDDKRSGFAVESLDSEGRLFQVQLYSRGAKVIYSAAPDAETVSQLRGGIGEVLDWADSGRIVSLVQHPFWCDIATVLPNSRVIYDCMDHHEGFGNTAAEILALERKLLRNADLTVTTSAWLDQAVADHAERRALIRNAGDFDHFAKPPATTYRDPEGRRVIGYYGAIAEWFDQDLVEAIARRFPDCYVLLVGADTVNAQRKLGAIPNVRFIGEVAYSELPSYLHGFDVCLLPFKVIPLTLATNPVKVYEYLSAGKPVVSVDLPEMKQFGNLVRLAQDTNGFLACVADVLDSADIREKAGDRQAFAKEQTWAHRVDALIANAETKGKDPKVSVIVVTYNNLDLTRACLASLDEYTDYMPLEIIVVDNASADGSKAYLSEWVAGAPNRKLILNDDNRGFAAANNQGLAIADGEYLVLLNNDTYVTAGWIYSLVKHLQRDESIGLIGPVTNNIGNEAKINIAYKSMGEMLHASAAYTRRHIGQTFPLRTAAFFCVMMPRAIYEQVGPLDEIFGRGFFEDDDYCRRVDQIGRRIVCAADVFVHHHLSASFNKLRSKDRQALFEQNKAIYEAKWGKWTPHTYASKD
jgi:GT2 family glycosyltransferase/glycosyltransferase involved in cell wall biosynthesis